PARIAVMTLLARSARRRGKIALALRRQLQLRLAEELSRFRQMRVRPRFRGQPGREDLRLDRRSERGIGDRAGFASELEHGVVREGQLARDLAGVGGRVE